MKQESEGSRLPVCDYKKRIDEVCTIGTGGIKMSDNTEIDKELILVEQLIQAIEALEEWRKAWRYIPKEQRKYFIVAANKTDQVIKSCQPNA